MALKDYTTGKPSKWVTLGGRAQDGKANPTEIEGYYLGRTEAPSTFDQGKLKVTYMVRTHQGDVGVNGSANLNIKMTDSEKALQAAGESALHSFVKITFTGTQPSKKGNPTKLFTVQFDTDDKLDENSAPAIAQNLDETDLNDVFGDNEEDELPAAPVASRERASAILNRKSARKSN